MQPLILAKDSEGLPLTNVVADLSDRMASVDFTWSAQWGPLDARIEWGGTLDEGFDFAERHLGAPIEIWSPDGDWLWEGLIWSIAFGAGQRRRTRSLEGYAEWVEVLYTRIAASTGAPLGDGVSGVFVGNDGPTAGSRPGHVVNAGDATDERASIIATRTLEQKRRLLWLPEPSGLLPPSDQQAPLITLECFGWYRTLWYPRYTLYTNVFTAHRDIIADMLTATCPYIAPDHAQLSANLGGASYTWFDKWETPGEIIKRLIAANLEFEYLFGLDRGRVPYIRRSRRFETTVDYVERIDGAIETAGGAPLAPWMIRPDTILRQQDFVPSSASLATAIDSVEAIYLTQTSYSSADNSVSYQGAVPGVLGQVGA